MCGVRDIRVQVTHKATRLWENGNRKECCTDVFVAKIMLGKKPTFIICASAVRGLPAEKKVSQPQAISAVMPSMHLVEGSGIAPSAT